MPFKDLEHDGNEEYVDRSFSSRETVAIDTKKRDEQQKQDREKNLVAKQEEWLDPSNPALWDGDF